MKPIDRKPKKTAFTIIELLAIMSVIILLISMLAPALHKVRKYAMEVRQKGQFHSIEVAMDLFNVEHDGYPPSGELGGDGQPYCGAMKLCEALIGRDLLGFHPSSVYNSDGTDNTLTNQLYPNNPDADNLAAREDTYIQLQNDIASKMEDLYGSGNTGLFTGDEMILCDAFPRNTDHRTGRRIGMPVLYYKADMSKTAHDVNEPRNSIYNYLDNHELVKIRSLSGGAVIHPMFQKGSDTEGQVFYRKTWDQNITVAYRPKRADSYILISAGFDGIYGTIDDVFNFRK